jgi:formylglycine-generating enzyme required for sulfatase activity
LSGSGHRPILPWFQFHPFTLMKMRSRLLGIVALAAVSLAAMALAVTRYHRNRTATSLAGFALIPAGEFTMGDSLDGDPKAPPHRVNVSAFYMGRKEVTKAEWDSVRIWAVSVWEWCWDRYYASGEQTESGSPASGLARVARGGGWDSRAYRCLAAARDGGNPTYASADFGFRLARSSVPKSQQAAERTERK